MGKRKPVQTNSKVDASPLNLAVNKGQIKELLVKELLNSQGKGSIPKDGGSKLKAKSLKSEIDDIFSVGKKKSQEASEAGTRAAVEAVGQVHRVVGIHKVAGSEQVRDQQTEPT